MNLSRLFSNLAESASAKRPTRSSRHSAVPTLSPAHLTPVPLGGERVVLPRSKGTAAFTMIEIALSLAVIGFALVAIIGVLPFGMNVQRENREETIINQDATLLMEAIRNGTQGMDDLTNYVLTITADWTDYDARKAVVRSGKVAGYTLNSGFPLTNTDPNTIEYPLTNGFRIIGLLSTPKYLQGDNGSFRSNFVTANIRAFSGAANEKAPQDNNVARDMGLTYRVVSEITTYGSPVSTVITNNGWDINWANYGAYPTNTVEHDARYNFALYSSQLRNLHDIRLLFRWPVLPGGRVPLAGGRQTYRTTASGTLVLTSDQTKQPVVPLFFIQPRTYNSNSL